MKKDDLKQVLQDSGLVRTILELFVFYAELTSELMHYSDEMHEEHEYFINALIRSKIGLFDISEEIELVSNILNNI